MTVYYIDYENGSPTGDGLSFATRRKSVVGIANPVTNDEIRIAASSPPVSIGNATWTNGSRSIVPATPIDMVVVDNCETAWTAAANVTAGVSSGLAMEGTNCANIVIATAFVTGKVAHKTLAAPLDLSAFDTLSFLFNGNAPFKNLELRLCTDTTGDVVAHTIPLAALYPGEDPNTNSPNNYWQPVRLNVGAMNASIQSVSLWATIDPGSVTLQLDNIVALKSATGLDHTCLISKDTLAEPVWYKIVSINPSSITIGRMSTLSATSTTNMPYFGTTGAAETKVRKPIPTALLVVNRTLTTGGTFVAPLHITGGWDRTAMTVRNDYTVFLGCNGISPSPLFMANGVSNVGDYLGFVHVSYISLAINNPIYNAEVSFINQHGADFFKGLVSSSNARQVLRIPYAAHCQQITPTTDYKADWDIGRIMSSWGTYALSLTDGSDDVPGMRKPDYKVGRISNSQSGGVNAAINGTLRGVVIEGSVGNDVNIASNKVFGLLGSTFSPTKVGRTAGLIWTETSMFYRWGNVVIQNTTVHTPGSTALEITCNSSVLTVDNPAVVPLAEVQVPANVPVTIKAWVRRGHLTNARPGIYAEGLPGVGFASVYAAGAINTWEQLTLVVTPTVAGILRIGGGGWGATGWAWQIADLEVT